MKHKYTKEESEHLFFTSDTHFNHNNIIKYCKRPFKSVEEMNEALIFNWNSVVSPTDTVFHLGDIAFCGAIKMREIISRLNGKIILIKGNHDRKIKQSLCDELFEYSTQQMILDIDGTIVYLNHFPYLCFHGMYDGEKCIQLFGHIHSNKYYLGDEAERFKRYGSVYQYDVGVDNNNFTPVSYTKIKQIIQNQTNGIF